MVRQPGGGGLPEVEVVKAGVPQAGDGRGDPGVAEQAVTADPAAPLPPVEVVADGTAAELADRLGREVAEHQGDHIEPGDVLLTDPPERCRVPRRQHRTPGIPATGTRMSRDDGRHAASPPWRLRRRALAEARAIEIPGGTVGLRST
jgi:hypothetical protein